jgi:hypothetical protein
MHAKKSEYDDVSILKAFSLELKWLCIDKNIRNATAAEHIAGATKPIALKYDTYSGVCDRKSFMVQKYDFLSE